MAVTRAIEFGALVGAQLSALIEAEVEAAEKTTEYIESVGFERVGEGEDERLVLRTVAFDMRRTDTDGVVRTHTIRVPVLTLIPIPLLTIEEATVDFDLVIEDVTTGKAIESGAARASGRFPATTGHRQLKTRLARTTRQDTTTRSDLKLSVRIAQSAFPTGIERLLGTADLAVDDETRDEPQ